MSQNDTMRGEYSGFAKLLHWSVVVCIFVAIPAAVAMNHVEPGETQNSLYDLHRSFGALILALITLRLVYRLMLGAPEPEPTLTPFQRTASQAVHHLLYLLLLAEPVIGWAASSAYGTQVNVFGGLQLPELVAKSEPLWKQLAAVHQLLGLAIIGLLALHIGAALFHYFVLRDRVMQRMLPRPTFRNIDS